MTIDIDVLRRAITQLLDHARQQHANTLELDVDLYWFIPKQALYVPEQDPSHWTLGSLEDDSAQVRAIANGDKEPIGHALV